MHREVKLSVSVIAAAMLMSLVPPTSAVAAEPTLAEMEAEISALLAEFEAKNPDFVSQVKAGFTPLPDEVVLTPILGAEEAGAWARDTVVYQTPVEVYADFLQDMYSLYSTHGAMGIEALKALTGAEIAELVADGTLPSHEAYKQFNLLAFYASLRDESNVNWLLTSPKTTIRAQERMEELIDSVTPAMREDAAQKLGDAMALAYLNILATGDVAGLDLEKIEEFPMPPAPPVPGAPSVEDARSAVQTVERAAIEEAKYVLADVTPLVEEVKLTAMNELTLILNELTSLTEVYTTLETYYYQYNFYYHYEKLERTWWYMLYIVDHIEQRDTVQYRILTENVYKLMEYLYQYQDLINIQGLVSGVLSLDYEQVVGQELPAEGLVGEVTQNPPEEVKILLEFVMPFTFDIVDELSLYVIEELVNNIINIVRSESHFYWEYHIRNYWYWDPLGDETTPFANAALNNVNDYLVTVQEDLEVGKVLGVIPITSMYQEASLSLQAPGDEYPLLDTLAYLDPAPVGFLADQSAAGKTNTNVADYVHIGPTPNVLEAHVSPIRAADHALGLANDAGEDTMAFYTEMAELLGEAYTAPTALYELLPTEIVVDPSVPAVPTVPTQVDSGVDTNQLVSWSTGMLPSFVPEFAFVGVRSIDQVATGKPIILNVNARGLGSPITFTLDLNDAALEVVSDAVAEAAGGDVPDVASPDVSGMVPAAGPYGSWIAQNAQWAEDVLAWFTDRI